MDDLQKSKKQLIAELNALRTEVKSLRDGVADRAKLSDGLQRSEDRYRIVSELTSDYAFAQRVEPNGDLVQEWVTGALRKISGFSADELAARGGWASLVHPDDSAALCAQLKNALNGQPSTIEYRIMAKNGAVRWTRDYSHPVWDEAQQRVTFIYGAIQDVTERKRAEIELEKLLAVEHEQRLLAETMATVSLALTSQTSHKAVLQEILQQVQRIVPFTAGNIVLLEDGMLRHAHWQGYDPKADKWMAELVRPLTDLKVDFAVVQARQPIVVSDCSQDSRWLFIPETDWIHSYLSVPICLQDRVLGLLRLDGAQVNQFKAEDGQRLLPLANAAAIALENARLYEEAQQEIAERKLAEAKLEYKTRQQDTLLNVAQHLTASLDLKELLTRVAVGARQVLQSQGCSLYLLEPDGKILQPAVSINPPYDEMLLGASLPVDASLTGQAVITGKSLIFNDAETWDMAYHIPGTPYENEHVVVAPFVIGDEIQGAICLNRFDIRFDEEDRMLAKTFAAYASVALENAQAYADLRQEVQKRLQAEMSLRAMNEQLKTTLDELQAAQTQLIRQERLAAVGQLAAGIAHDFNNMMAAILLYAELMLKTSTLSAKDRKKLQVIHKQGLRAADLTQQILDFSRKSVMKREDLDFSLFLRELNELLLRTLPENIQLSLESDVAYCIVNADPTRLQQVVLNLAINARDAMRDGGKLSICLARVEIEDAAERPLPTLAPGSWARLSVTDSGPGIAEVDLPHIFEPFFTTKGTMGSGLGLAQVHGIVKQHGGHVGVTTAADAGTRFDIYLPLLPPIEVSVETAVPSLLAKGQGETILVVEDDQATRSVLQEALETFGFCVLTAVNGREASAVYKAHRSEIALVISDLVMPEMGGEQLLSVLRELNPAVKIIIVTGYPLESASIALQESDGIGWLQKPVNLDALSEAVGRMLPANS